MTTYERSQQIWSVLCLAARNRQVLTYDIVGRLIGVPRQGLGNLLEPIQSICLIKGWPALTCLVVSETSGLPSPGFVAAPDVPAELIKVFKKDWLSEPAPSADDFERAAKEKPSNGIPST
jgi:hypothetical protein